MPGGPGRGRAGGCGGGGAAALVGGSDLLGHLHGPGAPHGAAVHKGLAPVPLVLQAWVDAHLAASRRPTTSVGDLGDGRGVVLL